MTMQFFCLLTLVMSQRHATEPTLASNANPDKYNEHVILQVLKVLLKAAIMNELCSE